MLVAEGSGRIFSSPWKNSVVGECLAGSRLVVVVVRETATKRVRTLDDAFRPGSIEMPRVGGGHQRGKLRVGEKCRAFWRHH